MSHAPQTAAGILLALGTMIVFGSPSSQAPAAGEIVEKMIAAQGGRQALAAVRDTTSVGGMDLVQLGMSGQVTMYQKEPDKMRMDIDVQGLIISQATDGEKAWTTNVQTGAAEEMPAKMAASLRRQALGHDALLNPEKYGLTFTFKGREKVGDKEFLVLEQGFQDGEPVTIYLDPATHLPSKARTMSTDMTGADVESETVFDDYRKVGAILTAHKMVVFQGGVEFARIVLTTVRHNTGLEDGLFRPGR